VRPVLYANTRRLALPRSQVGLAHGSSSCRMPLPLVAPDEELPFDFECHWLRSSFAVPIIARGMGWLSRGPSPDQMSQPEFLGQLIRSGPRHRTGRATTD
jgi:hypothetical protein